MYLCREILVAKYISYLEILKESYLYRKIYSKANFFSLLKPVKGMKVFFFQTFKLFTAMHA